MREILSVISLYISSGTGSCPWKQDVCNKEVSAGQESTVDQSKFDFVLFSTLAKDGTELACGKNT